MITNVFEDMLKDGYSKKMAKFYLDILEEEKNSNIFDKDFVHWSHSKGFSAKNAILYNINEDNYKSFLSDYDYYRIWPLNSWQRIWVNDKLTLKYMLSNTEYDKIMPKYYYYTAQDGLKALIDNPFRNELPDSKQFLKVISLVKEFACKPCNGSTSEGFFKLSFVKGRLFADDKEIDISDIDSFLNEHKNYVFTEYLKPTGVLAEISPLIHTLRIVVINKDGCNPYLVGGYLRIPNDPSFSANYIQLEKNTDKYNIFTNVDVNSGEFYNAKRLYLDRKENIDIHPVSNTQLCGFIENYNELKNMIIGISKRFNCIEYMGFDIGVSESGFKCMEINTHPGIGYMQLFKSLYAEPIVNEYFNSKKIAINNLSEKEIKIRNEILR